MFATIFTDVRVNELGLIFANVYTYTMKPVGTQVTANVEPEEIEQMLYIRDLIFKRMKEKTLFCVLFLLQNLQK